MELVLAQNFLGYPGGTETYLLTIAEQFQKQGHEVTIYANEPGRMADIIRARGIRITDTEHDLPRACDAMIVQDSIVSYAMGDRYSAAPQVFVVHAETVNHFTPPQLPGVVSALVVLSDRVKRRMEALSLDIEIVRQRQPIDIDHFYPRGVIRERPKRLLMLGNYLRGYRHEMVEEVCGDLGIECETVGSQSVSSDHPEIAIADADIVMGKARVILEGMSCGRAAYVFDHNGGDGWVTPDRYPLLEADNFGGRAEPDVIDAARLRHDLTQYRPEMGLANRDLVVVNHNTIPHADALAALLKRLAPRRKPVAAPMREMSRLVRIQWQADAEAAHRSFETEHLRGRIEELETDYQQAIERLELTVREQQRRVVQLDRERQELIELLDSLKGTRRYRFARAIGRPLDLMRRAIRRRGGASEPVR